MLVLLFEKAVATDVSAPGFRRLSRCLDVGVLPSGSDRGPRGDASRSRPGPRILTIVATVPPAQAERAMVPVFAPPSLEPDVEDVLVAIPAFNEERFIGSVVHEVSLQGFESLVIDDGSSDRTSAIASAAGAMVERHELNRGKAAALNTAFEVARRMGVSILVVMDGDWQHDPREIHDLIEPIRSGVADIVSGSRFLRTARGHVPGVRAIGMRALTIGSNVASGQSTTDSLSGFRAFGRPAIEALRFKSHGFSVEFEMQFMARRHGLRERDVPITARYDDPPKRNAFWYGLRSLDGLIRLVARFRPMLFFGVPSAVALLVGFFMGTVVIDTYQRASQFAAGYAALTVLLIILGSIGLFTAILLHVLRSIFLDLEGQLKALAATVRGGTNPR